MSWTDIIQTVAIVVALLFTAWEIRARTREQRFSNYVTAISGSVDLAKLIVENPQLHALYDYSAADWGNRDYAHLNSTERAMVLYCDLIIALCETVWLGHSEGHVAEDEWSYWQTWAHELNQSPAFRWTLEWVKRDYDPEFLASLRPPAHGVG